jgi:ATP-dependent NAD(P)H-hydrate dehydratase
MVHPLMRSTLTAGPSSTTPASADSEQDPDKIAEPIIDLLPRIHVLVVGPGLGRDKLMHEVCRRVLRAAREQGTPFVVDADALALVSGDPNLVKGYELAVLTPNVVEFGRLTGALGIDEQVRQAKESQGGESAKVEALAKALGGVTVVQKGARDLISNGTTTLCVDLKGGLKRSGGQGDTLTGSIATFLGWRKAYLDKIWETKGDIDEHESVALAVFGGASVTRVCLPVVDADGAVC